jgi:hypothetical protein
MSGTTTHSTLVSTHLTKSRYKAGLISSDATELAFDIDNRMRSSARVSNQRLSLSICSLS